MRLASLISFGRMAAGDHALYRAAMIKCGHVRAAKLAVIRNEPTERDAVLHAAGLETSLRHRELRSFCSASIAGIRSSSLLKTLSIFTQRLASSTWRLHCSELLMYRGDVVDADGDSPTVQHERTLGSLCLV